MTALAPAVVHLAGSAGTAFAAVSPSPAPTGGGLRPGISETDISPGLVGFLVTFALAVVCVLLFFSLARHLRTARHNAQEQGLEVEQRQGIGIRRDTAGADGASGSGSGTDGNGKGTGVAGPGTSSGQGDDRKDDDRKGNDQTGSTS